MNIVQRIIEWITGKSVYIDTIKRQQALIETLNAQINKKEETFVVLSPPRDSEQEEYASTIDMVWSNRYFKWFLYDHERAIIKKFKSSGDAGMLKGQLSTFELIALRMQEISDNYKLQMANKKRAEQ